MTETLRRLGAFAVAALVAFSIDAVRAAEPQEAPAIITLTCDGRILFRGESIPLERLDATIRAAGIPARALYVPMGRLLTRKFFGF